MSASSEAPFMPAEAFPVAEYLEDILRDQLTTRMVGEAVYGGDEWCRTRLVVDFIFELRDDPDMMLDEGTAAQLERATGWRAEFWRNTDATYRRWKKAQPSPQPEPGNE